MDQILGIDPGLRHLGWALLECGRDPKLIRSGTIDYPSEVMQALDLNMEVIEVANSVRKLQETWEANEIALEDFVYMGGSRTTIFRMAKLIGGILAAGENVTAYPPVIWMRGIIGHARKTSKDQVRHYVAMHLEIKAKDFKTTHESDAAGVALHHFYLTRR